MTAHRAFNAFLKPAKTRPQSPRLFGQRSRGAGQMQMNRGPWATSRHLTSFCFGYTLYSHQSRNVNEALFKDSLKGLNHELFFSVILAMHKITFKIEGNLKIVVY